MPGPKSGDDPRATRFLLACGLAAGPVYLALALAQMVARDGFDMRRHAVSHLSNGEYGWVQVASFLLTGALVIAGAAGARRLLHPGRGGTWGPVLLALYGIGLIGAGAFSADPAPGFPAGTEVVPMTRAGMLHFVFGAIGFYALIAACFVFARRYASLQRRGWAMYSAATGVLFFLAFAALSSGQASAAIMLAFYAAVALAWTWHAALSASLRREVGAAPARAPGSRAVPG